MTAASNTNDAIVHLVEHMRSASSQLNRMQVEPRFNDSDARRVALAIETLIDASLNLPNSTNDRNEQILAACQLCAQHPGNGFGDTVIWPALRRAGLHREAEEWTKTTNGIRAIRHSARQPEAEASSADGSSEIADAVERERG